DEAQALPVHLVEALALLRIRNEDAVADRLDPERRIAVRKVRVDERSRRVQQVPPAVEDVDPGQAEVGGIQPRAGTAVGEGQALEDRAVRRHVNRHECRWGAAPGAYRAAF